MSPKPSALDPGKLALFKKLVATNPGIDGKGVIIRSAAVNGHMFSFLTPSSRLALRLPPDALAEFLAKHKTKLCDEYGVVQKEYAMVPDGLFAKTAELKPYFDTSHAYVSSLKPKPSAKKKKAETSAKPKR